MINKLFLYIYIYIISSTNKYDEILQNVGGLLWQN